MKELEAYLMMVQFLEDRYRRDASDELGGLLGELQLAEDGLPFDPAFADDWAKAVDTVRALQQVRPVTSLRKAS